MNSTHLERVRRTYKTPQVFDYGNIHEITQAVNNAGNGDGGTVAGQKKTH